MLRKKLLFGCIVLSLIVSACGGIGGPRTVKIVATLPLEAVEGQGIAWTLVQAMKLALEEVNYKAGNLEVKIEVLSSAEAASGAGASPEKEKAHAEKAAADPEVMIYMGSLGSGGSKISIPILNRAGLAQISPTATYPGLTKPGFAAGEPGIYYPTGKRTFFRVCTTDDMQGPAAALWAKDLGFKRVYIVQQDDSFGQGLAQSFRQTAEANGMTIVGTGVVTQSQTTGLEKIVTDMAAQRPDLVYHAAFNTSATPLVRAMRAQEVKAQILGATLTESNIISELGADAEGVIAILSGIPTEQLGGDALAFIARYEKRYNTTLGPKSVWAILSYDAMRMALAAIGKAGKADRAAVLEALRKTQFDGLAGRWSFDENGDSRLLFVAGLQVKDGKWQSKGLLRVR